MKPLFLLVGKSGSGKTTIAEHLEKEQGMTSVQSYTTRPPRYENETGHIFVSDEEFDKLKNIIAYTEYNGYRYCSTQEQIDAADIYVIDPPGVKTLLDNYQAHNRHIYIIYFAVKPRLRIERMRNRRDSDTKIVERIYNDEEYDWYKMLKKMIYEYANSNLHLYYINANQTLEKVIAKVLQTGRNIF